MWCKVDLSFHICKVGILSPHLLKHMFIFTTADRGDYFLFQQLVLLHVNTHCPESLQDTCISGHIIGRKSMSLQNKT